VVDNTIKWALLIVLNITLISCQQPESKQITFDDIVHVNQINKLSLPVDAKILYSAESERTGNDTFIRRIIFSKNRLDNNSYKTRKIQSKSAYDSLRTPLKNLDIGLQSNFYRYSRWTNESGDWYGVWVETSNGFYLDLEQLIKEGSR